MAILETVARVVVAILKLVAVVLVLLIVAGIGFWVSYPWLYPTYVVRYRLTVDAVLGERRYNGSNVIEVRIKMQPRLLDNPPWTLSVEGEPTVIDLGDGRNLVALLYPGPRGDAPKGAPAYTIPFEALQ